MFHRGVAGPTPAVRGRAAVAAIAVLALVAVILLAGPWTEAQGSHQPRCERFVTVATQRAAHPQGHGHDVLVLGDSWSVGLGLRHPMASWPSRLPGRVHVAGFSGSGYSAGASSCGRDVAFDRRAASALGSGADLVVVEGGLNDFDQPDRSIRSGFARLMRVLRPATAAYRVVVIGPPLAPSRADHISRVDRLLRQLCATYGVDYVATLDLDLPYLPDRLHLTAAGHRQFGDAVARRIAGSVGG